MKQRIAIPISQGFLDAHFGHCKQFALAETEGKHLSEIRLIDAPPHEPGLLPGWLAERGVTDIIAGGMGQRAVRHFNEIGLNVYVGAPRLHAEELVQRYLEGTLTFSTNNCGHKKSKSS